MKTNRKSSTMKSVVIFVALVPLLATCQLVPSVNTGVNSPVNAPADPDSTEWVQYKLKHGKVYDTEEDVQRLALFLASKDEIDQHNDDPNSSYKLGLNHLSDWTPEEFAQLNGFRRDPEEDRRRHDEADTDPFVQSILNDTTPLPAQVDWRQVPNRVTAVKDQSSCGSCWAFASTGVLEGQQVSANKTKSLIPLSEQNLMDCSRKNNACYGGNMYDAFEDVVSMGGIESEQDYPYVAAHNQCKFNRARSVMDVTGAASLPMGEEAIQKFVARYGPVAIGLFADQLQQYQSGIFDSDSCIAAEPNHGVLAVGYGTDPQFGDYWLVKNSWSDDWGEQGYFRIKRGVQMCLIGSFAAVAKI